MEQTQIRSISVNDIDMREQGIMQARSCLKCNKFKTCVIFMDINPTMEHRFGMLAQESQPFQTEQLAWLCKEYELKREPESDPS